MTDIYLGEISDSFIIISQNKMIEVNYTISQILKKAQFKFKIEFEEEGGIKKPKVTVSIINEIRPKKIESNFINSFPDSDIIEKVNIEPNNVNYTMNLYYSTKSKVLFVTTVTDFESYKYSRETIKMEKKEVVVAQSLFDIVICMPIRYLKDEPVILISKKFSIIPRKASFEEFIVHENSIFKE